MVCGYHAVSLRQLVGWRLRGHARMHMTDATSMVGAEVDDKDGLPQSVEITDDALALRIPLGPDDSDNNVVGARLTCKLRPLPRSHQAAVGGRPPTGA